LLLLLQFMTLSPRLVMLLLLFHLPKIGRRCPQISLFNQIKNLYASRSEQHHVHAWGCLMNDRGVKYIATACDTHLLPLNHGWTKTSVVGWAMYGMGSTATSVFTTGAALITVGVATTSVTVVAIGAPKRPVAATAEAWYAWSRTAGASISFPDDNNSLVSTLRSSITRPPARRLLGLVRGGAGLARFMPLGVVVGMVVAATEDAIGKAACCADGVVREIAPAVKRDIGTAVGCPMGVAMGCADAITVFPDIRPAVLCPANGRAATVAPEITPAVLCAATGRAAAGRAADICDTFEAIAPGGR